jgi:hypothetical protein
MTRRQLVKAKKDAAKQPMKKSKQKGATKVLSAGATADSLKSFIASEAGEDKADAGAAGSKDGTATSGASLSKQSKTKASLVIKKKGSMKKPAAAMKKPAAVSEEARDRMKDYYFKEALRTNTLDGELHDLWQKIKGSRKKETALINGVMSKFQPDKNSPQYQEVYSKITANFWKDEEKAIPESLAIIKFKTRDALMEAVHKGDVKETEDEGKKYYSWRVISIGKQGKSQTNINVNKAGKIDSLTYDKLSTMLENLKWNFSFTTSQQKESVGTDLPKEALEKVEMARGALAKVSKQAVACLGQMKAIRDNDLVKQGQGTMSEYLVKIRAAENNLEAVIVLGTGEDGKSATCSGVLRTLGSTAKLLEDTFAHVKACGGLLRGTK